MKEFSLTVKFIRIEGFEDAVLRVDLKYGEEVFSQEKVVEIPSFKSIGQKVLEQMLYEVNWMLRKEWSPRNPEEYNMYTEDHEFTDKSSEDKIIP